MSDRWGGRPILAALGAVLAWAAMMTALVQSVAIDYLLLFWPVWLGLAGVALVTAGSWAPAHASAGRKLTALALFIAVQALGTAPLALAVFGAGEAELVVACAWMSCLCAGSIIGYGVLKQTFEIEPVDALVTALLTVGSVLVVTLSFGLHPGFVVASPLLAIPNILLLQGVGDVMVSDGEGRTIAGALRLFSAFVVISNELGFMMLRWGLMLFEWLARALGL